MARLSRPIPGGSPAVCKPSHSCIPIPGMLPGTSKTQPSPWQAEGGTLGERGVAGMAIAAPLPLWRKIVLRVLRLAHSQPLFLVENKRCLLQAQHRIRFSMCVKDKKIPLMTIAESGFACQAGKIPTAPMQWKLNGLC